MKSINEKDHPGKNGRSPYRKVRRMLGIVIAASIIAGSIPSPVKADIKVNLIEESSESPSLEQEVQTPEAPFQEITDREDSIIIAERIKFSDFTTDNLINTENQAFIVNMTTGTLIAAANLNQTVQVNDILRPMIVQVVLENCSLDEIVTITKKAVSVSPYTDVFGLKEGDKITVGNLLSIYLLSGAEDAYLALIGYTAKDDMEFLSLLNKTAASYGLTGTNFKNITGKHKDNQGSSLYDAYSLYRNLMKSEWFMQTVGKSKLEITYKDVKHSTLTNTVENMNASWCISVNIGGGYKYFAQISSRGDNDKDGQFVIFTDSEQNYYLSYLGNVNSLRNIGTESGRLIRILSGYPFSDSKIIATPTPLPTAIPTPKPTQKPTPTAKPTPTPKPTPVPTPTPVASKSGLPTANNNARYQYIMGTNYKAYTMNNPPVGYKTALEAQKNMTLIIVPVWKMNSKGGKVASSMAISIHNKLAKSVSAIFREIYALDIKFPIKTLIGYSYRKVGGVGLVKSTLMSAHSFGSAIDINPGDKDNDYFLGKGNDLRDKSNPYCIPDEVIDIFESHGWFWGGNFEICSDTMHFQYLGLEFLTYQGKDNFRKLKYEAGTIMSGSDVRNLQQRLNRLGFTVNVSGNYYKTSASAVKNFQKAYDLPVTGVVDYKTWETIINLTHDMSYVF